MMLGARKLWDLIDHFMSVIQSETDFPVLIYDTDGYIIRATEADRIGDLHAGAEMIMQAQVEEYAVTAEEAALNPMVREGFSCPIIVDGQIVAGFGITGKLALAKPVAKIAVKIIEAWIQSQDYQIQLERSERNYRDIFDHSLHGIYQATMEGQFLAANVAMAKILGYLSPEALIAKVKSFSRQLYAEPEDRDRFLAAIKAHGEVSDFETRFMRRDGKIVDIRINSRIKHDPESDLPVIEGLMEDITERKMAESAIRQSEEKFTKVFHNSPVCVVLSAMSSGRYIEVNETFLRTMGYTRDEVIGRTSLAMRTWIDPRDRAAMAGTLNSEGRVRNLEVKRRTKTGETLTMLFSADRIEISGKICLLSVSQDITGRKRMEGRLRDSETHLKTVLDSVEDAVIAIDRDGTITRMNRQAEMLTGWTCLEADGQHINAVVLTQALHLRCG